MIIIGPLQGSRAALLGEGWLERGSSPGNPCCLGKLHTYIFIGFHFRMLSVVLSPHFFPCRLLAWFWAWWLFLVAVEPSLLQSRYQWLGLNFYFPTQVPFGLLPQPADAPHCRSTCHCSLALSPGQVASQLQCDRGLCSRTHLNTWWRWWIVI